MRINISLRSRIALPVILILVIQVAFILYVIQSREIRSIYAEQQDKGILLAKNIAQENLDAFVRWDYDGVKESIEDRIDNKLIYVIFYNRFNRPFVGNDFIENYDETYQFSNFPAKVSQDETFFQTKNLARDQDASLRVLEIEIPVFMRDSAIKWGSLKIGLSLQDIQAEIYETRLLLILIGLGSLLVGFMGVAWLSHRITEPIKKLVDGTVKISQGDFSLKIDIDSQDEIGNLAQSFNEMSHQLLLFKERMEAANKKLVQVEKLASIGHISAGIAHEIRNPLTAVKLNIQKLLSKGTLGELEMAHLDISREGIAQIEKFIKELLNYARISELNLDWFSVQQIIDGSILMMEDSLELKKVSLEAHLDENLPQVRVDADKLRQVILNILHNAREAVAVGGRIDIYVSEVAGQECRRLKIEIADNGPGIPEKDWKDIFEPFYTTKASGIGLGLANAMKIMEQLNGLIRVKSNIEAGTTFEIILPCGEEQ